MGKTADEVAWRDPVDDADEETGEIEVTRDGIEQTRSDMSGTIDAIKEKLNPQTLLQHAKDTIHDATIGRAQEAASHAVDTAKDAVSSVVDTAQHAMSSARETVQGAGSSVIDTLRENPIPAALAGIGIGWLWMSVRSRSAGQQGFPRSAYRYDDRAGYEELRSSSSGVTQLLDKTQSKVSQVADRAQDKMGQVATQVQAQVSQISSQAQDQARRTVDQFERLMQENPLAVGAAAVALGAAMGLLVPQTSQENRWMGETRDKLAEKAQETAQEMAQKVQTIAGEALDSAKAEAKNQGLTP